MIVALSGVARSGKDTVAAALIAQGWEHRKFAAPLRLFLEAQDPLVDFGALGARRLSQLLATHGGWEQVKDRFPEVRRLMQRTGTEAGRGVLGDSLWVDRALDGAGLLAPVVLTDCRFVNEADAVRASGGLVLRVERPGVGPKRSPDGSVHSSETALDGYPFDAVLSNNGTVERLHGLLFEALAWHGLDVSGRR